MDSQEVAMIEPTERTTIHPSDFDNEEARQIYAAYLKELVLDTLIDAQPWGINGETMAAIIIEQIVEESVAAGFPEPDRQAIQEILDEHWNLPSISKSQYENAKRAIKMSEKPENKSTPKGNVAPLSGLLSSLTIVSEIGGDASTMREVAQLENDMVASGHLDRQEKSEIYQQYDGKHIPIKAIEPDFIVVNIPQERIRLSKYLFRKDDMDGLTTRWDWMSRENVHPKARKPELDLLSKSLFMDVIPEQPVSAGKPAATRTRGAIRRDSLSGTDSRGASEASADEPGTAEGNKRKRSTRVTVPATGKKLK